MKKVYKIFTPSPIDTMQDKIQEIIEKNKKDIEFFTKEMEYKTQEWNNSERLRYHSLIVARELAISDLTKLQAEQPKQEADIDKIVAELRWIYHYEKDVIDIYAKNIIRKYLTPKKQELVEIKYKVIKNPPFGEWWRTYSCWKCKALLTLWWSYCPACWSLADWID